MNNKKYQEVLKEGCGWEPSGGYDTDGDCSHGYDWECDNCPITIERMNAEVRDGGGEA
jgi:hypothetical protein